MLQTALTAYRRFYTADWPQHLLAGGLALLTVPLYLALALLMERVAGGASADGLALLGVAGAILVIELLMDVWLFDRTLVRPQRRVQRGVLARFLRLPPARYPQTSSGELSAAAVQYLHGTWFLRDSLRLAHALISATVLAVIVARVSWPLALVSVLPVLLIGVGLHLVRRRWVAIFTHEREARARLETFLTDTLHGVLTVKLYAAEQLHTARLAELATEHNRRWFQSRIMFGGIAVLLSNLGQFAIPLFLTAGGYLIGQGQLSAAELLALYVIFNLLNTHLYNANFIVSYVLTDLGQMRQILDQLAGEQEGETTFPFQQGRIEYRSVSFGYSDTRPIVEQLSLSIAPGEKLAIVGPSGAGKSSLLALLLGLQQPQSGAVYVDGTPVTQDNAATLRQQIASVGQQPFLFDADLLFNLTLGQPRTPAQIERALRIAGLEELVAALPDGFSTRFGPGGLTLSGGEQARVCLARALLLERPVLLLDEVTAQIDSLREEVILQAVLHDMPDTTVVAISHRLSSVCHFPRIVLLEQQQIQADGTHQHLLQTNLRYRQIFGEQVERQRQQQ